MLTMKIQCDVAADHTVTVKLPEEVGIGRHELVLVVDIEMEKPVLGADALMRLSGSVPAFAALDGVAYQRALRDEWS
ncbi:MAG: hypothetical protein KGZ83_01000 [Sulfuricella sp.]|nr:hypothetical protein [Sulfuricella sp.]